MSQQPIHSEMVLDVENIGGIDETSITFGSGVTVLAGRNATNRTSLLQAIMAALGSDRATLKSDADEGSVSLSIDGTTYDRTLRRDGGTVVMEGSPYLDDPELADLFAFLLEDNDARRAVERGDDLREVIMRPVDTEAIQAEIEELTTEKRQLTEELSELDELERQLPGLEAERTDLEEQIEQKKAELAETEAAIDTADGAIEDDREIKAKLDEKMEELRDSKSELDDVRFDIETTRESLESLREKKAELEDEFENLPETSEGTIRELDARLESLHERKQSLSEDVTRLQNIIQFNEEMMEDGRPDALSGLSGDSEPTSDDPTDKLLEDAETITCWTCGSTVDRGQVSSILVRLRELRRSKLQERNDLDDEIGELRSQKEDLERQRDRREQVEREIQETDSEIDRTKSTIEDLESRREDLEARVEELETRVDELESQEYSELLELHRESNQLEFEIERLESDLEDTDGEIASIEEQLDRRAELESQREAITSQLEELRTEVDRIEETAVDEFNEHIDAVLTELEYRNIERVWIERLEREVREGRRKIPRSTFELHVVRETDAGNAYEDTVDHLSESEREVIGLIFALAGYLTHDVNDSVPFMLLDSLEELDSERIAGLVDYLRDHVDNFVVALLPEDAAEVDGGAEFIRDI